MLADKDRSKPTAAESVCWWLGVILAFAAIGNL